MVLIEITDYDVSSQVLKVVRRNWKDSLGIIESNNLNSRIL